VKLLIGNENVFDAGEDVRGYTFLGLRLDNEIIVAAGCRWLTIEEARYHWHANPDALMRVARIAEWAVNIGAITTSA
jgi:hypothetical protein